MFCSKCGKELDEETAFCPSCGNRLGGMPQTAPPPAKSAPYQEMTAEEKKNKLIACMAYFLCMVCDLIFVWLIVGSKATLFLGSDYSEQVLKALWDSFSSLCLIIAFFVTVADFVVALWFYVYAYITRSFSKYKAYVGLVTSSAGLGMGVMVITLSFVVNDKLDYFPWFMVVAIAMVCAVNIFADIKYIKAAGSESSATLELTGTALKLSKISSESVGLRDDYWECPECGTRNSKLSNQCKDCGKYR